MKPLILLLALAGAAGAQDAPGVISPARAKMNWMLNCQGCHQADGAGTAKGAPGLAGEVSRFLGVKGGREFLTRVPGVANAGLPNDQLTELLNWTLSTFDPDHLPAGFEPYNIDEIAAGRAAVLVSDAPEMRARLVEEFSAAEGTAKKGD